QAAPIEFGGPTLVLSGTHESRLQLNRSRVIPLRLSALATRLFACGQTGLKGEVAARVLERLSENLELATVIQDGEDLLSLLMSTPSEPRDGELRDEDHEGTNMGCL